ncbi:hypothetical protein B7O87_03040 [Cylindrospermopsis raciborskii CENA303]|uniref:phospholipase D n=1 Tax=Cylindrospermopsis raciborskii CENA303 TaxID=1170769 RepID=A0A1X4GBC3_9CYAN|nr:phospholipase D-like domain-containing protein [Cylindrospermopsis raciborskii]OSO94426.1 hypothetical protein B7O87_03040 [Cylindrospermopsis raciborskii CENA303]
MLLDPLSIDALLPAITGESNKISPYRSGPDLISWFNPYGFQDEYLSGLPENKSRSKYALARVQEINNDDEKMRRFIESIVDPRRFIDSELDVAKTVEFVNSIIKMDGLELRESLRGYRLYPLRDSSEPAGITPVFEEIQSQILDSIEAAEFCIWVAVAWFTDPVLYNALAKKRREGISVRVILIDDEINRNRSNFKEFPVKWISPEGTHNNLMHCKFCVIDLKKVIHGSYNWTNKARFNNEQITVIEDKICAEDFAKEFVKLAAD